MQAQHKSQEKEHQNRTDWWKIIGFGLLVTGATIFIENQLRTGWIYFLPFIVLSILALRSGMKEQKSQLLILGIGLSCVCLIMVVFFAIDRLSLLQMLGISTLILGVGWFLFFVLMVWRRKTMEYWALLLAGGFIGLGLAFLWREAQFIDFVLWLCVGISIPLLIWGYSKRYFGLLIAGFIILSSGVGVSIAWAVPDEEINSLTRTGVMLICFALGWGGISVFSKHFLAKVAWWPLIPAGVLGISGWGLFIGGSPGSSKEYVGNTLSLALIILGVYVLLLRSGFNKKQ